MRSRKAINYWGPFNVWWRGEFERSGIRPSAHAIARWYAASADAAWGTEKPSLHETRTHAKCLRSVSSVRNYFREYRAKKKHELSELEAGTDGSSPSSGRAPGRSRASRGRSREDSSGVAFSLDDAMQSFLASGSSQQSAGARPGRKAARAAAAAVAAAAAAAAGQAAGEAVGAGSIHPGALALGGGDSAATAMALAAASDASNGRQRGGASNTAQLDASFAVQPPAAGSGGSLAGRQLPSHRASRGRAPARRAAVLSPQLGGLARSSSTGSGAPLDLDAPGLPWQQPDAAAAATGCLPMWQAPGGCWPWAEQAAFAGAGAGVRAGDACMPGPLAAAGGASLSHADAEPAQPDSTAAAGAAVPPPAHQLEQHTQLQLQQRMLLQQQQQQQALLAGISIGDIIPAPPAATATAAAAAAAAHSCAQHAGAAAPAAADAAAPVPRQGTVSSRPAAAAPAAHAGVPACHTRRASVGVAGSHHAAAQASAAGACDPALFGAATVRQLSQSLDQLGASALLSQQQRLSLYALSSGAFECLDQDLDAFLGPGAAPGVCAHERGTRSFGHLSLGPLGAAGLPADLLAAAAGCRPASGGLHEPIAAVAPGSRTSVHWQRESGMPELPEHWQAALACAPFRSIGAALEQLPLAAATGRISDGMAALAAVAAAVAAEEDHAAAAAAGSGGVAPSAAAPPVQGAGHLGAAAAGAQPASDVAGVQPASDVAGGHKRGRGEPLHAAAGLVLPSAGASDAAKRARVAGSAAPPSQLLAPGTAADATVHVKAVAKPAAAKWVLDLSGPDASAGHAGGEQLAQQPPCRQLQQPQQQAQQAQAQQAPAGKPVVLDLRSHASGASGEDADSSLTTAVPAGGGQPRPSSAAGVATQQAMPLLLLSPGSGGGAAAAPKRTIPTAASAVAGAPGGLLPPPVLARSSSLAEAMAAAAAAGAAGAAALHADALDGTASAAKRWLPAMHEIEHMLC